MFRVIAETTVAIPPHGEWLAPYYPNSASVNDPNYLVDPEAFDWNGSAPAAQSAYLVRCIRENRFDMEDLALLAADFFRRDYRSLGMSLPLSPWIAIFVINYLREVHDYRRSRRNFWLVFLSKAEVRAVPVWDELWG